MTSLFKGCCDDCLTDFHATGGEEWERDIDLKC